MKTFSKALGVSDELGLVFGYAAITKKDGEDYFDLADDNFTDESIIEATVDFMMSKRAPLYDMHDRDEGGSVVFAWPMTEEIAKAFNIETDTYGLMIAVKPEDEETLQKFRTGEYTGFSLGGAYIETEEV